MKSIVRLVMSKNGNPVVEVILEDGTKFTSSPTISKKVSDFALVLRAMTMVRESYLGKFRERALAEDFYPRVRGFVNKIFSGSVGLLNILSENVDEVVSNRTLFYTAREEVLNNDKRSAPSREQHPWITEKIDPRVLDILGI